MILKRGGQAADMMVVAENLDAFDGLRSELEAADRQAPDAEG